MGCPMRIKIVAIDRNNTTGAWKIVYTPDGNRTHNHPPSLDVRVNTRHRQRSVQQNCGQAISSANELVALQTEAGIPVSRIYSTLLLANTNSLAIPKDIANAKDVWRREMLATGTAIEFKEIVLQMKTIEETLDETRQLVLLLGSLTDEYKMIWTVFENTPNMSLAYAIQALSDFGSKRRFIGKCFYCKKQGHKEFGCRIKKVDEERDQVAQVQQSDFSFTATSAMTKTKWLTDSGASSHMTSVRDKHEGPQDAVRITIADGTKIDAVATSTIALKLMDGTSVRMSDVLYTSEVEGSLMSVSKLDKKDVVAQFNKDRCVFRYRDAKVMEMGCLTSSVTNDDVYADCFMGKMRADNFTRHPENLVKSAGDLDVMHTDVMDTLSKFKIYKTAIVNETSKSIKRLRLANGGEYIGGQFKSYLNQCGNKHDDTVPYTPQQNGLAERINRSLVEMARHILYHEDVAKKCGTKPQRKNLKVFASLGYAHIADEEHRKLDSKALKCRIMDYEDGVKGYRVMDMATGKVQIVRTVKFMKPTTTDHVVAREDGGDEEAVVEATLGGQQPVNAREIVPGFGDVIPLLRDEYEDLEMVPYQPTHPIITRSRDSPIDETTEAEEGGARKKQLVAPSAIGTKRQKMIQERVKPTENQLAITDGQAMVASEAIPKTTKAFSLAFDWMPLGEYSQRYEIDYEETYAPVAYLHSIRVVLAKCCAEGFEIGQSDVDTEFLYGKLDEEIYAELLGGLRELMTLANAEGEDDVVCLILQVCMVSSVTIYDHLKGMGFKTVDADSCVYTQCEGDDKCVVCLYLYDMLIASRDKGVITSVKAGIAERLRINDLGRASFILGIAFDYDINDKTLGISRRAYTESVIKNIGQESAKLSLMPLHPSLHVTKDDRPQTEDDKRFLDNPGEADSNVGIKEVRYLLKTKGLGITYDGLLRTELTAYADSDWDGNRDDRRSESGMMLLMCGAPVVWRSMFQKTVALSTTENIGADQVDPTVIYEDNQGVMALAKNKATTGEVELVYEGSKNELVDFITKGKLSKTLRYLMTCINLGPKF
ncbi:polyprotein [Phytophthora megakarya]|uniref:Polyprotein n=1 Tax=Phytophthora megakarya TaxID=4795 RepID=A0A225WK16_9STRA|nr:polyprotein [Phytophthora megakarya]